MSDHDQNRLESYFITFLQSGIAEPKYQQIEPPQGKRQVFYGLFLTYCENHEGNRTAFIDFLSKVFVGDGDSKNLRKNSVHCIKRYKDFVKKRKDSFRFPTAI